MIRKVGGAKQFQNVTVSQSQLKPFLSQYQQSLEHLRLQLQSQ